MSTLYIVTVEEAEDGAFYEEPVGFDSEADALAYATKQPAPKDHVVAVYDCHLIKSFDPNQR